jgi:hypothetical protein
MSNVITTKDLAEAMDRVRTETVEKSMLRIESTEPELCGFIKAAVSRLTRAGATHGMKLKYDLGAVGVEVIFATEGLPSGDHSEITDTVGFYAAQQYVKSLSFATTRGMMSSLERGHNVYCLRPPYGIDRLYVTTEGKKLHIMRNLGDGTQVQLHPETGEVIATFGTNVKGQSQLYNTFIGDI